MGFESSHGRVVPVHNLCNYFRTSIDDVITQQGIELDPHATHYVDIGYYVHMCDADPVGPDIHANDAGYVLIADTIAALLLP